MKPASFQTLSNWLKRAFLWTSAILIALLITGRIYQTAATQADQEKFPAPGVMVNVDGYQMHIYCAGEGGPTILLDHVGDGSSMNWALIQPELAKHTRVCAYDRAGFGWSDYTAAPRTLDQQALELHGLLKGANEKGPYILVGHSYGARVSRIFAAKYPQEVLGMVLMDPGMINDDPRYPEEALSQLKSENTLIRVMSKLAPFGLARLLQPVVSPPGYDLPEKARLADASFYATDRYWRSLKDEEDYLPVAFDEERSMTTLGDIPLLVLISTEPGDAIHRAWNQANLEMAELSTNGSYQVVQGATHMSLAFRKSDAQVCTQGILSILDAVRTRAAR